MKTILALTILLASFSVYASCFSNTIIQGNNIVICTTCCDNSGYCTTTCI